MPLLLCLLTFTPTPLPLVSPLLAFVQAARDVLGEQVLPALAEAERKSGQKGGSTGAHSLSDLPLGFDTGGKHVWLA